MDGSPCERQTGTKRAAQKGRHKKGGTKRAAQKERHEKSGTKGFGRKGFGSQKALAHKRLRLTKGFGSQKASAGKASAQKASA